MRPKGVPPALAVMAALVLSSCSAAHDETASTPTRTTASPRPTVPAQPTGAHGVTYDIQNWDEHAEDPAVLAWKRLGEAIGGSSNTKRLDPELARLSGKKLSRALIDTVRFGWSHDLHVPAVARARIVSSKHADRSTRLVTCYWGTSAGFHRADGSYYGETEDFWLKHVWRVEKTDRGWVVTTMRPAGRCRLDPPT